MNKLWLLAAVAALAAPAATVPVVAKVNVVQSSSPLLARGSTFAWAPVALVGHGVADPDVINEIAADRLRVATETALVGRGYRQVADPQEADLLIAYTIVVLPEHDAQLRSNGGGCVGPLCAAGGSYRIDERNYTQDTLVLDLVERQTGRLAWRATSKKRVTGNDVSEKKLATLLGTMTRSLAR